MTQGLSPKKLVNVTATLTPRAVAQRGFGVPLFMCNTAGVVDTRERFREYLTIDEVVADGWPTDSGAYKDAVAFFSQSPQPVRCFIGFWANDPVAGLLHGALLTPTQQLVTNFTAVTNGSFRITVDNIQRDFTDINLSSATNLNGVATLIQTAMRTTVTGAVVKWDSALGRFNIYSGTTGADSKVSFGSAVSPATGTDISGLLGLTAASQAPQPVDGMVAETPLAAVTLMANLSNDWYAAKFSDAISDSDHIAVANFLEAASPDRTYWLTTQAQTTLDPGDNSDIMSALKGLSLSRTATQYSSTSLAAIASLFGRQATVNFDANNTVINLMWKIEPGITPELLTETQASALKTKNGNVFVKYSNDKAIIQWGTMANGDYIDERVGIDWLKSYIQNVLWNVLYQTPTKVPQTDEGTQLLITPVKAALEQARRNGLLAPGQWRGQPLGQITYGDMLPLGYYVFSDIYANQSQADREARKAMPIQILAKFAGAVNTVDCALTFNR